MSVGVLYRNGWVVNLIAQVPKGLQDLMSYDGIVDKRLVTVEHKWAHNNIVKYAAKLAPQWFCVDAEHRLH